MTAIDTMRTAQPLIPAGSVHAASAADSHSFRKALQDAAITIPQLLRQRATMHGDALALREK
jgi:long-chain acyl-CoA synthetase